MTMPGATLVLATLLGIVLGVLLGGAQGGLLGGMGFYLFIRTHQLHERLRALEDTRHQEPPGGDNAP